MSVIAHKPVVRKIQLSSAKVAAEDTSEPARNTQRSTVACGFLKTPAEAVRVFGRLVIAIGSNETAVRLSGIRVWIYKFLVYSICGGFASIAGIISTARTGVGSPVVGMGMELDAIAAVVIGGASLSGGKGTALNTLFGVFILGMIGNIMNLKNVPAYPQQVIKGLIIIFAVLLQGIQRRSEATKIS